MAEVVKPPLYDSTGKPAQIPEEHYSEAIASGKFGFPKGVDVPVINPEGQPVKLPADVIHEALKSGYKYDTSANQLDRIKTEETSGAGNAALAFGAGAARGATFGLSDLAAKGLGFNEKLADLQKYRPNWSGAGELAGVVGSLAIPGFGEENVAAKGAQAAVKAGTMTAEEAAPILAGASGINPLTNLVTQAGKATEAAIGGTEAAKVLGGLGKIGATAAGSAVEGALYSGVGNSISEYALGDPDLNGEKIASNFGYGALGGALIGGALKGAEIGLPPAVNAISDGLKGLRDTLVGSGKEGDAGFVGKTLDILAPGNKISDALGGRHDFKDITKDLNLIQKNTQTAIKDLSEELKSSGSDLLSERSPFIGPKDGATDFTNDFMKKSRGKWTFDSIKIKSAVREAEETGNTSKLQKLDTWFEHQKTVPDKLKESVAKSGWAQMKDVAAQSLEDRGSITLPDTGTMADILPKAAAQETPIGGVSSDLLKYGIGAIARHHPVAASAMMAYKAIMHPEEYAGKLAAIERLIGKNTMTVSRGAKSIFSPATKIANQSKGALINLSGEERAAKYNQITDQLQDHMANPDKLAEDLHTGTETLHAVAPAIASSVRDTHVKATQFLASKIPQQPQASPFEEKYQPSQQEISQFDRYFTIANDPLHALKQVADGTIVPETTETLINVYPKLYAHMRQAVMEEAASNISKAKTIPYQTKQALSVFLGEQLMHSMNYQSMVSNQLAYAQAPQATDKLQPTKASKEKMSKITLGKRSELNHGQFES